MAKPIAVHARFYSLGGIILCGLLLALGALAYGGWFERALFVLLLAYIADAWSEKLILKDDTLIFDSFFRRRRTIDVCNMRDVLIVHEGLNPEHGIVSVRFRPRGGNEERLPLGPLWKRDELEAFFGGLENAVGSCKLVEEVR